MVRSTKAHGKKTNDQAMASSVGLTRPRTKASGTIISDMALESSLNRTAATMKDSGSTIIKMGMLLKPYLQVKYTLAPIVEACDTVKVIYFWKTETSIMANSLRTNIRGAESFSGRMAADTRDRC
jgi:hypothetical protein